jgi:hypothetical protein
MWLKATDAPVVRTRKIGFSFECDVAITGGQPVIDRDPRGVIHRHLAAVAQKDLYLLCPSSCVDCG